MRLEYIVKQASKEDKIEMVASELSLISNTEIDSADKIITFKA